MKKPIKYFLFNKKSDFQRGSMENIALHEPGISINDLTHLKGCYFSRLLDSREKENQWHRMIVDRWSISGASIKFTIYVSESDTIIHEGECHSVAKLLSNPNELTDSKIALLKSYEIEHFEDPEDVLLFNCIGRYLWFRVDLYAQGNQTPKINTIKLIFPKNTWLEYLPEIYQKDRESASFVERFLGIYQSLYQDMTDAINQVAQYMDPDAIDDEFLHWLAQWIAIDDSYIWSEEKLRYLVKNGVHLYSIRGTSEYLETVIELYTGKKAYIVEAHQIRDFKENPNNADLLVSLYGDNSYVFTVIIDTGGAMSHKDYKILSKIIENAKPAHIEGHVVVLEPYIFLNQYAYLGINSVLGKYHDFVLDGHAAIPFTTL